MSRTNLAERAGRWSAAHWKSAAFGWLGIALVAVVAGNLAGAVPIKPYAYANGDSRRAEEILDKAGFALPARESVLVQSRVGRPGTDAIAAVASQLQAQADVTNIITPLDHPHAGLVSRDGRSALVQFEIRGKSADAKDKVAPILAAVDRMQSRYPQLVVAEFGQASADRVVGERITSDMNRAWYTSLPLTLAILGIAFGALVAAGLPVLLALSAVLAATGINALFSHVFATEPQTVGAIILMMGMAVGIDYSLFYLRREREERHGGARPRDALLNAARTSGQAVLISGSTVLIAMAGMFVSGNTLFTTIGVGTMIVVFAAMVGSLTVLPAVLHRLGDGVDRGRIPVYRGSPSDDGRWARFVGGVLRRPVRSVVVSAAFLVVAAIPAANMHTKLPNWTDLPHDLTIVRTFERIQQAFPGSQTPVVLVVKGVNVDSPAMQRVYTGFRARARASGQFFGPFASTVNPDGTVARIDFAIAGNGDNGKSLHALRTLRDTVLPQVESKAAGAQFYVTGITAGTYDFNAQMRQRLPFVFLFVLGLAFLLLLVTFRSLTIAVTAVALNLLSVAAAYGILAAVFQKGWLAGALGFQQNGAVVSWLPLFLFVVLFGLSMDYHVFIVSRIKELHDEGMRTDDAIRLAITRTAGTVTSAAIIMVAVFGVFATLSVLQFQQMGFGLAVAVLIDATLIRAVLLPATMKLLGEWNWYLPRWLEWLPSGAERRHEPPPRAPALPV
jgi:uncharacterized membrane protein YdfJ with MMPL/SSD domain